MLLYKKKKQQKASAISCKEFLIPIQPTNNKRHGLTSFLRPSKELQWRLPSLPGRMH